MLIVGAIASIAVAQIDRMLALAIAFVVAHFFLFCNVLRMSRPLELTWASIFAMLAIARISLHAPSWPAVFGVSILLTIALAIIEMRRASYHGVGWRSLNPKLPEWWQTSTRHT